MLTKTEEQILAEWVDNSQKPLVTIACLTYNHENYLRQALDGFLMQETDFPFEIIIHDDASIDENPMIIKEYVDRYPTIIKPILQTQNQYSLNKRISIDFIFESAKGNYIAFCEGDDYWTDTQKLQKQYDALEKYKNINICLHYAELLDETTGKITGMIGRYNVDHNNPVIPFEDIINKPYGQIPTASTFIRANVLDDLQSFFHESQATIFDVFLHILGANSNGAYLLEEPMSVYRINVPGSWTDNSSKGKLDSHVFKRAEAFQFLEDYVPENYIKTLRYATFHSFIFILKMPYASKLTKRAVLQLIKGELNFSQRVYFRLLTELNLIHRIITKLKILKNY